MTPSELSAAVQRARRDARQRERLIAQHRDFVARVASLYARRKLDWRNDDELSVALMAFDEAIDTYDPARGEFHAFAGLVIRRRLADHFRREQRAPRPWATGEGVEPAEDAGRAWEAYQAQQEVLERADELERYRSALAEYGLSLRELAAASPKHRDTKATLVRVARFLAADPALREQLERTRRLPLRALCKKARVSRKVLESGRKYVIGLAIILIRPEFEHLRSHLSGALGSRDHVHA